ncbi:MAG: hypothetical protein ACO3YX_07910 [Candidatus Nanopelagicaceae bacterium]|jgi:hypothetical protein
MTVNEILNAAIKGIIILLAGIAVFNPEAVGHWEAKRYIAYDSIWLEYIGDCDCSEPFPMGE